MPKTFYGLGLVLGLGLFVSGAGAVGLVHWLKAPTIPQHAVPQHVTCFLPSSVALAKENEQRYVPLFAFDSVDVVDLSRADVTITLTTGQALRAHIGEATCFELPLTQAPTSAAPQPSEPPSAASPSPR